MKTSLAYLIAPILGYVGAQALKFLFAISQKKTWRSWFSSGGMPSSHTAVVVSLAAAIFFSQGFSELFAVSATLCMVTIYDALVARRSIGEQGTMLIRLVKESPFVHDRMPFVALGHRPAEVAVGVMLGLAIGKIVAIFITN